MAKHNIPNFKIPFSSILFFLNKYPERKNENANNDWICGTLKGMYSIDAAMIRLIIIDADKYLFVKRLYLLRIAHNTIDAIAAPVSDIKNQSPPSKGSPPVVIVIILIAFSRNCGSSNV